MAQNIFDEYKEKKNHVKQLACKAKEYQWLTEEEYNDLIAKIDSDVLRIGVIGQMKCGKSTFLNAFVFEDDILPAATTPMTAALSVITYGKQKKIVAEFYNREEWEEQKMNASYSIDDASDEATRSKIQAAQELVRKSKDLSNLESYITKENKTQEDSFDNLIEYVGADGKYVSITKSVKIFYPKEYLDKVEIVDTPGFNDPIVSREERTKEFLKKADVVLLMLYAGRAFDATDRNILFKNVNECGIGNVLIGINKYDVSYEDGVIEEKIVEYVCTEIEKSRKQFNDTALGKILESTTPIPISANMALMSELPMTKISGSEDYTKAWRRSCDIFEISSQPQMRDKSHIDDLINAIRQLIEKNKEEILIAKPINRIVAAGNKKLETIQNQLKTAQANLKILQTPDKDLEEKSSKLNNGVRRMNKKINGLADDIEEQFNEICRKGKKDLENIVYKACSDMNGVIDDWGIAQKTEVVTKPLSNIEKCLMEVDLPNALEELNYNARKKVLDAIDEFLDEASDVFEEYVDDYDSKSLFKSIRKNVTLEIEKKDMLSNDDDFSEEESSGVGKGIAHVAVGILFGGIGLGVLGGGIALFRMINHNKIAAELRSKVNDLKCRFNPQPILNNIKANKTGIIENVKKVIMKDTLEPIQQQLEECLNSKADKAKKIKETESKIAELADKVSMIKQQVTEVEQLKNI